MQKKINFLLILFLFLLINICVVSASDVNMTDESSPLSLNEDDSPVSHEISSGEQNLLKENNKTDPVITTNNNVHTKLDSLEVNLKDSDGKGIGGENLIINIVGKNYTIKTDSKGIALLKIGLKSNKYPFTVFFNGNDIYNSLNKSFTLSVLKSDTELSYLTDSVMKSSYFTAYLKDNNGNPLSGETVSFTVCGKTYNVKTAADGVAKLKIGLACNNYPFKVMYKGNAFYNAAKSLNLILTVPYPTSISIGNAKLLTNGYLRIYLKSAYKVAVNSKYLAVFVNNIKFTIKTSPGGIISFKPFASVGKCTVIAKFYGTRYITASNASKTIDCIKGDALNPLTSKVPLVNGAPNIDYLIRGYVHADENGQYTLTKSQYREVLQRDSYCLYLNGALSKYTYFKTKEDPIFLHILKREKWNVIERAINTKIVNANRHNYWPDSISVNLNGKQYSYSEVRDVQDTGYTCGPTSCSICSQALRNYVNEKYLGQLAGSTPSLGSSTRGLKVALEKNHMQCSYFYKGSWNNALKQLSKGGCALVFHTWNHYVAIIDISADGKKVLVVNPSGDYNHGSHSIPTNWLSVSYMYGRFNNYDTSGLIVKLKYSLSVSTKNAVNNFYSNMGANWNRHNVGERVPEI